MSSEAHPQQLIIVRRHDDEEHDPHNSAWKVAHADFMTAMMAFFLIMWLINVTDDEVKKSIANYFNPVKLSESVTNRKGLNTRDAIKPQGPEKPGDDKTTLSPPSAAQQPGDVGADQKLPAQAPENPNAGATPEDRAAAEQAAFRNPYSVLDKLAAEVPPAAITNGDAAIAEVGQHGTIGSEVSRDPFDPVYWQMRQAADSRTDTPGVPSKAQRVPVAKPDATALAGDGGPAENVGAMRPSLSADAPASADAAPATQMEASAVEAKLIAALASRLPAADAPHIEVKATGEGILIDLTDDAKFSMFEIGSAIPKPAVVIAMEKVAEVLAEQPGDIIIRGYTDGRPFHSDTYDNWRLSTARAHMAYYMLARGGLPDARVKRIEGRADRDLKNPVDPNAAENRRIEILLRGRPS